MKEKNSNNGLKPNVMGRGHNFVFTGPKVKAKNSKETLMRLWSYLSRRKAVLITVFLLIFISTILSLAGPYFIGKAIDTMTAGAGKVDFQKLTGYIVIMVILYGVSTFFTWIQIKMMINMAQETVFEIRDELFAKLQTLNIRYFDTKTHGEIMSRLTNDIENINITITQSISQLFSSLIMVTGSAAIMFYLSWKLTLLSMAAIPVGMAVTGKIIKYTRKYFSQQQKELGELNGYIEEIISGEKVVKVFGRESKCIEQFDRVNRRLNTAGIKAQIYSGIIPPFMNVINNISFAVVAAAGGWLVVAGTLSIGVIASFLNYSKQFARPINEIANQINMIQSAIAGAERVFEVMDESSEFNLSTKEKEIAGIKGDVLLENVDFSYTKEKSILKNVNIHAKQGETVAIVGPTGAGKTTIVNLLTRFYEIDNGKIYIDGSDIKNIEKKSLRSLLGIVLQDTYIFEGSVRENIRYGRIDATDKEVAARMANAEHFILQLHNGYETILSEDGSNLSQGQRQLITIARAILADPAILILDEATSSVDTRTELHIQEAMLSLRKGRTSFVIAHRLSTIRDAEQIVVMNNGEIIENGTHDELLEKKGFFYNMYNSQFRGESE